MSSVFIARQPADKTKAEKRISRLAKRTHSDARARRAPGPVKVISYVGMGVTADQLIFSDPYWTEFLSQAS